MMSVVLGLLFFYFSHVESSSWPVVPLSTSSDTQYYNASINGGHWVLDWSDDFNTFDNTIWQPLNGTHGNVELQEYVSDECYVNDGMLVLRTRARKWDSSHNYTSCWVDTEGRMSHKYGLFEVRAKLPFGQGMWPAHWLMPDDSSCWPSHGEIDIMEVYFGF